MQKLKTIEDAINFLYTLINYEVKRTIPYKKYNNSFINQFLCHINYCEKDFKIIHIAGTNGKGSLAIILSHLLSSWKYITGCYTSPHLVKLNERIKINNIQITDSELLSLTKKLQKIMTIIPKHPSFFDAVTAIAILHFKLKKCQYVILETGMGGRLDSTNFKTKKISLINTISYDHTNHLGATLNQIAYEKAGIISNNGVCVLGKQKQKLYPLFYEITKKLNASIFCYKKDFNIQNIKLISNNLTFTYSSIFNKLPLTICLPYSPIHQALNCAIALFTLSKLKINYTEKNLNKTLNNLLIPARFQIINHNPTTIIDGAHNEHAILSLKTNLYIYFKNKPKKVLILGMIEGKNYKLILSRFLYLFNHIIITKINSFKNDISNKLAKEAYYCHSSVSHLSNFEEAYNFAMTKLSKNDLLVITGSFYLAGEAMTFFKKLNI